MGDIMVLNSKINIPTIVSITLYKLGPKVESFRTEFESLRALKYGNLSTNRPMFSVFPLDHTIVSVGFQFWSLKSSFRIYQNKLQSKTKAKVRCKIYKHTI